MQLKKDDLQLVLERLDLARHVYGTTADSLPAGWSLVASSAENSAAATGFYAQLYKKTGPLRPDEAPYAVAFRGTHKASDLDDVRGDIKIFFQRLPRQHQQGLAFVQKVCAENKIDPKDIEFVGHSSGGYVARTVAMMLGARRVWAFNSPGPSASMRQSLIERAGGNHLAENQLIQIRSTDDVVGKWGFDEGIILEVKTKGDHHSIMGLRQGIVAVMEMSEPQAGGPAHKTGLLRHLFNAVSQKVTHSVKLRSKINHIFGHKTPPRMSMMRAALH